MNSELDLNIDAWLYRSPMQAETRLRLFCFPYAGGGAAVFRLWPDLMPPGIEVCRIQLPGRESRLRETAFDRMTELLDELLPMIRPLLDAPFAFFGHSMGALVSFEVARALRREVGLKPRHLFVSAWRAPQLRLGSVLHTLPEAGFLEKLQARFAGIPEGVLRDREILEMLLPTLRADLAVCETYEYAMDPPFDFPITVFGGRQDSWISPSELAAWDMHTNKELNVEMFSGGHFFINEQPEKITQRVAQRLERAVSHSGIDD